MSVKSNVTFFYQIDQRLPVRTSHLLLQVVRKANGASPRDSPKSPGHPCSQLHGPLFARVLEKEKRSGHILEEGNGNYGSLEKDSLIASTHRLY